MYVAGNDSTLGSWNPRGARLLRESDTTCVASFLLPVGYPLEFKITRGSWQTEAIYEEGTVPQNWTLRVLKDTTLTIRPRSWNAATRAPRQAITGTVEYLRQLKGNGLRFLRDVIVWLPPSYASSKKKRYAVLYMHDGQNVFDPATSFAGFDWQVDEVCDSLIRAKRMEEVIVVGIYNSPDRMLEYSDTSFGHSYADFVVGTLKPMIDSTYRTKPDRDHTAVMGSSLGGLISFLFAWWYPDVFSKAGCLSSAFNYRTKKIFRQLEKSDGFPKPVKVYMDCGGAGAEGTLKPQMDEMATLLASRGMKRGKDFITFYEPSAVHNERAWAKRVWRPLIFFFGTERPD